MDLLDKILSLFFKLLSKSIVIIGITIALLFPFLGAIVCVCFITDNKIFIPIINKLSDDAMKGLNVIIAITHVSISYYIVNSYGV